MSVWFAGGYYNHPSSEPWNSDTGPPCSNESCYRSGVTNPTCRMRGCAATAAATIGTMIDHDLRNGDFKIYIYQLVDVQSKGRVPLLLLTPRCTSATSTTSIPKSILSSRLQSNIKKNNIYTTGRRRDDSRRVDLKKRDL